MKRMLAIILLLTSGTAFADSQTISSVEALKVFERIIKPAENSAGFHSLEMPRQRDLSPDVPITVDAECLRFAIVTGIRDKPMCRKHSDINKLMILANKDGYFSRFAGDYDIVVFYKGLGKLAILSVSTEEVDPFIAAARVLSPSLKKVKDRR